jgi:hypothetical protein
MRRLACLIYFHFTFKKKVTVDPLLVGGLIFVGRSKILAQILGFCGSWVVLLLGICWPVGGIPVAYMLASWPIQLWGHGRV